MKTEIEREKNSDESPFPVCFFSFIPHTQNAKFVQQLPLISGVMEGMLKLIVRFEASAVFNETH